MKKRVCYLLTVMVLTGLLAGCGEGQGQEEEPATAQKTQESAENASSAEGVSIAEAGKTYETAEPEPEGSVLHIYCIGEDFKSRMQDYYPDYEITGDDTGKIGESRVKWHVFNDDAEYRDSLNEVLEDQSRPPEEKVDLYVVKEEYLRDYVESGNSLDVMADVGLTAEELADQFPYTQQIAMDRDGKLKALSWQATPGVFTYRRSIAAEVLGSDDPETVQEAVSDWDRFAETAQRMKEAGYYMLSAYGDAYQVYSDNVSSPWVRDGVLNIDPHLEDWAFQTREFAENGYIHGTEQWSDEWRADHTGDGEVFGFFYSSWGIHYTLQDKAEGTSNSDGEDEDEDEDSSVTSATGDYAVCRGPQPSHFGGQWIVAAPGSDDTELVRKVLYTMTCDPAVLKKITGDIKEFTNTVSGMKELAESDYKAEVLGGQNPIPVYVETALALNQRYVTSYDDDLDLGFQVTMQDYFEGRTSETDALETFRKAALSRYEELTESPGDEEEEEEE